MQTEKTDGLKLTSEEMRSLASLVTDILIERIDGLEHDSAWDGEFRKVLEDQLGGPPPEDGSPAANVLRQVVHEVLPKAARLDHPRFFGFIPSSPTWLGILADYLAAGFNINSCTWLVSSGTSQLELTVTDWMRSWIGYPETAGGILTSGGSAATVEAFVTAREAAGHPDRPVVYMSDQSHGAQKKAALIAGVRRESIRVIPTDANFRIDLVQLRAQISKDRANGLQPVTVAANAGTTSTGAIDPLSELHKLCSAEGIWLHVDAAYGGFATVTEIGKKLLDGIQEADSIVMDAHKWFFQPYEIGALMVKDKKHLENAFFIGNDVLQDTIWGTNHPNFADRGQQLSRAARALKIWVSVQTFGMVQFRAAVQNGLDLASRAADYVNTNSVLELLTPVTLGIMCFRVNPSNSEYDENTLEDINRKVLVRVFWDEFMFFSSTSLKGVFSLRMCITNHNTSWEDVQQTLDRVTQLGQEVLAEM